VTNDTAAAPTAVVLADAEAAARVRLATALRQRGFEVIEAENGLEVLLYVKRTHPGAAIITLDLPRVDGLEALRRIRLFDPGIRIVVLGPPSPEALAEGAVAVLPKPVRTNDVVAALNTPAPSQPSPPPPVPAERARILIVDDNADLCDIMQEALTPLGHATQIAHDAASALRLITQGAPDVVLLDIDLPGLSGIAALPAIHAIAPTTRVIMVSGTSDDALARRALAAGAFDYVVKPVDLTRLAEIVELALLF
jgi:two-component system, sensor histidine kinase and response regulator